MRIPEGKDAIRFFEDYLNVTGLPHTGPETEGNPELIGKRLGLVNGSSWITLWANYFGRQYLPGVHLINVGNEAVQLNFMEAYEKGLPVPPQSNINAFVRYADELVEFADVDAVLITCSTMNRAYKQVQDALVPRRVPVLQIDRPMMERTVKTGGRTLVIATHGPTVQSTQALLRETAAELGQELNFSGLTVESAWDRLALGDVTGHNHALETAISEQLDREEFSSIVMAQLSMTVFLLSHPDPLAEFGLPVFTSGQCGFERVREHLSA